MRWPNHTDFDKPIKQAVFSALTAAGVTVYDNVPPGAQLPYVVHDDVQQTDPLTRATCPSLDVTVTLRAYSRTIPQMRAMTPTVMQTMTNGALDAPLAAENARVVGFPAVDTFNAPDNDPTGEGDDTHPVFGRYLVFQYTIVSL